MFMSTSSFSKGAPAPPPPVLRNVAIIYDGLSQGVESSLAQATYGVRLRLFGASTGRNVQIAYGNFGQIPDALRSDITLASSVSDSGVRACSFSGSPEIACPAGSVVLTDPITVTTPNFFSVRSRPKKVSGSWPLGVVYGAESQGGFSSGADLTPTGSGDLGSAVGYGFGPMAVIAERTDSSVKSVVIRGDSIAFGQGDGGAGYTKEGYFDVGWVNRSLNHAMPYVRWSKGATYAADIRGDAYSILLYQYHDYFICTYGVNDLTINSAATIKSDLLAIWTAAKNAGLRVAQTTITPRSPHNAKRIEVNDYIRSMPAPLDYVIEVADAVETARNSGTWKAGYSDDDIHPNTTGCTNIASAVSPGLLADIALA